MEHKEYKRIVPQANTAVLFIHGIAGTPNHFEEFIRLVPDRMSVYNILLDGHGKGVRDFSRTSMQKWEAQAQRAVDALSAVHEQIYIVAHSMGTLLAIEQAQKNKKIAKLFLLAVPLKLFLKPGMISNALKVYFDKIKPDDRVAIAARNCYGITNDKNIFSYLGWAPRFLELFSKIRFIRNTIESLHTPCGVFQSSKDELVSVKSIPLLQSNPVISVTELKNSGHYYYDDEDFAKLTEAFEDWIADS